MYKICIWTPTKSHHQNAFQRELFNHVEISLQVRYFRKIAKERIELGWEETNHLENYEKYTLSKEEALNSLENFRNYIHIVSGNGYPFTKDLISYFIKNNIYWINWTERSGGGLFKLLKENSFLFKISYPIFQYIYNRELGYLINNYALGTFVNGKMAEDDYVKKGVKKDKIKHLYYALEPLNYTNEIPQILKKHKYKFKYNFIYVGRLSNAKGTDVLIKAFSKIKNKEWGLILVGKDTSSGFYKNLTIDLKIKEKVIFTGVIESKKINEFISSADVFILPTRYDGWGAVLNEASSLSKPIISTNECGAAIHIIEKDKNGFVVKAGSRNDLLRAMQLYIKSPKKIKEHGEYSLKIFQNYTPKKNAERFLLGIKEWLKNDND